MRVLEEHQIKYLQNLRRRGFSLNELVEKTGISQTTVWHHVHNIRILPRYLELWKSKRGGSKKRTERAWERARKDAQFLLRGSHREKAVALAMLYWAEGNKRECEFTNTDGRMIQFFLAHLQEIFGLTIENIRVTARIFSGMEQTECVAYWSSVTGVPKYRIVVYRNDGGSSGRTKYGICRITIRKGSYVLKVIHSLVSQLAAGVTAVTHKKRLERAIPALVAQRIRAASS